MSQDRLTGDTMNVSSEGDSVGMEPTPVPGSMTSPATVSRLSWARLYWLPYLTLIVVLVTLALVSFFRYHFKHRERYKDAEYKRKYDIQSSPRKYRVTLHRKGLVGNFQNAFPPGGPSIVKQTEEQVASLGVHHIGHMNMFSVTPSLSYKHTNGHLKNRVTSLGYDNRGFDVSDINSDSLSTVSSESDSDNDKVNVNGCTRGEVYKISPMVLSDTPDTPSTPNGQFDLKFRSYTPTHDTNGSWKKTNDSYKHGRRKSSKNAETSHSSKEKRSSTPD